jgi:hypothetical protein
MTGLQSCIRFERYREFVLDMSRNVWGLGGGRGGSCDGWESGISCESDISVVSMMGRGRSLYETFSPEAKVRFYRTPRDLFLRTFRRESS